MGLIESLRRDFALLPLMTDMFHLETRAWRASGGPPPLIASPAAPLRGLIILR